MSSPGPNLDSDTALANCIRTLKWAIETCHQVKTESAHLFPKAKESYETACSLMAFVFERKLKEVQDLHGNPDRVAFEEAIAELAKAVGLND